MPPEYAKDDMGSIDKDAGNIWKAGCIIYELCTLKHIFEIKSGFEMRVKLSKFEGNYEINIDDKYSSDIKTLLSKILIAEPGKRAKVDDLLKSDIIVKRMNNNKIDLKNNFDNNDPNNIIKKFTFCQNYNFNNFNKKVTPLFRKKIEREINLENPLLKRMLSSVPRHERNRSGKRQADEKEKLLFTNGIFRVKSFDSKYNKKFTGYNSMVMPPNSLNKLNFSSKN